MIHRTAKNKKHPFAKVNKRILTDKRLSWKAKGLIAYLLSKPDDWKVIIEDLVNQGPDGKDLVSGIVKELMRYDYLQREIQRDEAGKIASWDYDVHEMPGLFEAEATSRKSTSGKPSSGKPSSGKPATTNKGFYKQRILQTNEHTHRKTNK